MVSRKESRTDGGSATTGYLILSGLTVVLLTLFYKDPLYLVFAIPLAFIFTLGASSDKTGRGSVDDDLEAVGWSDKGMELAIPLGIIGGMVVLFLGSIMTRYSSETASIFVPDFTNIAALTTASVIPVQWALSANIIAQWMVVAPAEEALARVLAVYAFLKIFKNVIIAFILAAFFWMLLHVPTYISQNANSSSYLVLLLLAVVTTGLYIFTKNLMSSITAHGVFNTGVLLIANRFDTATVYIIAIIMAILVYAWISGIFKTKTSRVKS